MFPNLFHFFSASNLCYSLQILKTTSWETNKSLAKGVQNPNVIDCLEVGLPLVQVNTY